MQINLNSNIKFTARNKNIRFADDIARRVNCCFPRVSPTNIDGFICVGNFFHLTNKLNSRINILRFQVYDEFAKTFDWDKRIQIIPDAVKLFKVGNCAESATLAKLQLEQMEYKIVLK